MGLRPDDILNRSGWTPRQSRRYNPRLVKKPLRVEPRAVSTSASVFRLSRRLENVGFSDIVKIRNKILELRAGGAQVFQFEGGEPFLETPEPIKEAMTRALAENRTRYAPSSGIPELRAAVAEKLRERNRIHAREEDVVVMNGGMQGLFAAFQSVVDPGDEVLVFSPFWTPIRDLIAHCEGKTVLVRSTEARREGFYETLARHATDKTRAVYFNTPQNPTGIVFTREEAEAVARFARERDLVVLADEAYEDLVYEGEHFSIASLEGMFERTITCYTLSKSYAMTGWRMGYAVAAEPWMTGLKKCLLYTTNGVSTPSQWAALAAFGLPADFYESIRRAYRERRDLLVAGLCELGLACDPPAGAFYAFPDVSRVHTDSRAAADILLERARVATVPGVVFGEHGESHLRFSFSTSPETIQAGLDSLRRNL
ncbi:MAG: aminotransferase class I/II-fold pyridoxal phosphate-dependent enzyme [Acidobacteria bacterium]|nr:aminotransferase class I/II-fold pyridoxal phosphate-dependent enzyme [Acidobacteriota bacterium]